MPKFVYYELIVSIKMRLRWPGVEPGSTAWKAAMLTAIPPTLDVSSFNFDVEILKRHANGIRTIFFFDACVYEFEEA